MQKLYSLEAQYKERVWGGQRLKQAQPPIGEAWIAYGGSRVGQGEAAGRSLDELNAELGAALVGQRVHDRFGSTYFPLLIKLLDAADWLSVQVHPDDEQARQMVGPDAHGKTEAWHFLAADAGARILAGVKPGTSEQALADAIRNGTILDVAESLDIRTGDSVGIPAGTLHALGPGLFLYEIQQESDTTYRVYDWDRPASAGRALHIEESVAVTRPDLQGHVIPLPDLASGQAKLLRSPYFALERLELKGSEDGNTGGQSFHLLTSIVGEAEVTAGDETVKLKQYETVLVAGSVGAYAVSGTGASVLRAWVPGD